MGGAVVTNPGALGAVKTVKLAGAERREVERVRETATAAYARYLDRNRAANGYVFWQTFLSALGKALVLAYGGWQVFAHRLTPGDVVMFVAAGGWFSRFAASDGDRGPPRGRVEAVDLPDEAGGKEESDDGAVEDA